MLWLTKPAMKNTMPDVNDAQRGDQVVDIVWMRAVTTGVGIARTCRNSRSARTTFPAIAARRAISAAIPRISKASIGWVLGPKHAIKVLGRRNHGCDRGRRARRVPDPPGPGRTIVSEG